MADSELVFFNPQVRAKAFSIGTTPTRIVQGPARLLMQNRGTVPVYLGGADVTATDGFEMPAGTTLPPFGLAPGAWLYAVTAGGTSELRVMLLG